MAPRLSRAGLVVFPCFLAYEVTMSITGTVKNGVVVLPPGTQLPEGTAVKVESLLTAADDPLVAVVEARAKVRSHLPADYALNHGHYIAGEPKK